MNETNGAALAQQIRITIDSLNLLLGIAADNGIEVQLHDISVRRMEQPCDQRMLTAEIRRIVPL